MVAWDWIDARTAWVVNLASKYGVLVRFDSRGMAEYEAITSPPYIEKEFWNGKGEDTNGQ